MAIGTNNNILATRIQLKSDTEANWIALNNQTRPNGFIPLSGELIIYTEDTNHSYCRLKIGDGSTNVVNLHFIDAGTLNGNETFIDKYTTFDNFPSPGKTNQLYIDLSTNYIYHYTSTGGYKRLSDTAVNVTKASIPEIVHWGAGSMTKATVDNCILSINNGTAPQLLTQSMTVVTNIAGGNAE